AGAGGPRRPHALEGAAAHPPSGRRRLLVTVVTMVVAFAVLAGRLVQVQGLAADRYAAFGESQRVHRIDLPADRGAIFDRNGHELALTVRQATVTANPRLVADPLATAQTLAPVLGLDRHDLQTRLTRDVAFVYLARRVDDAVARQVEKLDLPGVALIDEPERFLPAGDLARPLLGRVGTDNGGLSGLELQFDRSLRGRPGKMTVERDPSGRNIPGGLRLFEASARGDDLVLTIDRSLQYETERSLAAEIVRSQAKGGMAVVMDTRTGELLALANLRKGERGRPPEPSDQNMALTSAYEPGSVNKMITISAALEEGIIQPENRLTVPNSLKLSGKVFREHDASGAKQWSVTEVMANSSNVGSILIGQKLGKDGIDGYLRAFGFGTRTPLRFPGESSGILLDPERWSGTSLATIAIGQGVAVTAVQMLAAYNTVANGGTYVAPTLVKARVDTKGRRHPTPPPERRRVLSARTARQVTGMLQEVVRVGTGKLAAVEGYAVAGKTGTARKPLDGARGYAAGAYVSSFAGFVPAERPALSAIVILDEPTPIFGGLVAAPVFAEVARYGLRQLRVPPPPPAPPTAAQVPKASPDSADREGDVGILGPTGDEGAGPPGAEAAAVPSDARP
ncbi:MAG: penicillin-binding protein 2, partial [Actinomycetota bacterium]|nr:penicillin-binding protein 2 [Actinomycetota bacterium]